MRRGHYETREESRETIIRGRLRERKVPKSPRSSPRKKQPQNEPQNYRRRQNIFQHQRDERSTSSTEKSSLYNYNTDHSSHTQQTEVRTNISKPSLFKIAESAGATLAAAAISPFDKGRRGIREDPFRNFDEEDDDDLRESPSDELPLNIVEKAIDKVVDATCGSMTATTGTQAASLLAKSYLKTGEEIFDTDGIVDPIIPNPFEGLRSETRPIYEAASFPKVTFREVKLDPKKTIASTAMQYPEPSRPLIRPKIPRTTSVTPPKTKSPIKSMANRVKSVQTMISRRRNRPVQESKAKKAELLEGRGATTIDRYTRARAHSDTSENSGGKAKLRRRTLGSYESREDAASSPSLALHECPSVRDRPTTERTNRARHNRSIRQPTHSDESDTSDPSLPPRLPLHKSRQRSEKSHDESSGAQHSRNIGFPLVNGSYESSVDPYSSVEKCESSSSSTSTLSNDLIPQVDDYTLPTEGNQQQDEKLERKTILRERRIHSDPNFGENQASITQNEASTFRETIKRRRAVSQPNPYPHYHRMAQLFAPILYRVLAKCQRKCLTFDQETESAIVPRLSTSQEYVLSELINAAVLLMHQCNTDEVKRPSTRSRRKHRRRRRKRSSVLDELCNQISFLDQKLLEITNESMISESAASEGEDHPVADELPSFIEQIEDWSDDEIPPEVEGIFDESNFGESLDIHPDLEGSLGVADGQHMFGGMQSDDPEFNHLIEMAYVVTDLSRDQFIDAHQKGSVEEDEDDDLEQELTNLSFVEEIIQTELSQVDSGEGTYKEEWAGEEHIQGQFFSAASVEETFQDESFSGETDTIDDFQTDTLAGIHQDHSDVEETIETGISSVGPEEGTLQMSVTSKSFGSQVSGSVNGSIEEIYEEEPFIEQNILTEVSVSESISGNGRDDFVDKERITESTYDARPVNGTQQQESFQASKVQLTFKPQEKIKALQVTDEGVVNEVPKKMHLKAVKKSMWEDAMFPDDELIEDADLFPDDEMSGIEQQVDEMNQCDQQINVALPISKTFRLDRHGKRRGEGLGLIRADERSFFDLQSVPSDEKDVTIEKSRASGACRKHDEPERRKEQQLFQRTTVATPVGAKGDQMASKSPGYSRFKNINRENKEIFTRKATYIPRANQAETLSNDAKYLPREREVSSVTSSVISPHAKIYDDAAMDSIPSDEGSEGIKESDSVDGCELKQEVKEDLPEDSNWDALTTSVVEGSIDEKNPAVEIIVAPASHELDSKQIAQPLDTAPSCETEDSDSICAAVNRKLAEVRRSCIPDPDDEMIMETIGMSMSMNSISKTPKSATSGTVPDPEDSMIVESLSSCHGGKLKEDEKARLDNASRRFLGTSTNASSQVVMETVYLAESEMVTEKLFTVSEEGTAASSCNASIQGSTRRDTNLKRDGRQNTINGKVREAIMKFNGGGGSPCSSPMGADLVRGAESGIQKRQSPRSSFGSNLVKSSTRPESKSSSSSAKGNAAALIARFEAKGFPVHVPGTHSVSLKKQPHTDEDADQDGSAIPLSSAHISSFVHVREESENAMKHSERSAVNENEPPSLVASLKMKVSSPSVKPSPETRQQVFYDKLPNLLSASPKSALESLKRQGKEYDSPSRTENTLQPAASGNGPNSLSNRELRKNNNFNELRSQFESKLSLKKPPLKEPEGSGKAMIVAQSFPKMDETTQSKTSSRKQLPLHGFVKANSKTDPSNPESLIDKVKPPVHKPSKNFFPGPIDFKALNKSLLQMRREEMVGHEDEMQDPENQNDPGAADDDSKLPITELHLKEVTSLISELDGPRIKLFSSGMCHCFVAGGEEKKTDEGNSIEQLKKVGRRQKIQSPLQADEPNHDELASPVFSIAMLDDNMQRTADAAVKALDLVLTQGAANAAAAIKHSDSQVSCFNDCITPVAEGTFNAFSHAVTPKSPKQMKTPKGDDHARAADKAKAGKVANNKAKMGSKELSKNLLALNDDTDDWARIAIEENNVEDLIEALRSESSELDPFMSVSFAPSTPMTNDQGSLLRLSTTVSPIFSDWAGSIARLGAQPLSSAQRDEWSKRNLLSGTTTFSSAEDSEYFLQQHRQQPTQDSPAFDERKLDIDFRFESPSGSIRGPYDGMIKEQRKHRGLPPKSTRSKNRSKDPPTGGFRPDEDATSKGKRGEADRFEKDYLNYTYEDQNGKVTKADHERPYYYDFPAPPSQEQQFDSEISELTLSQAEMTHSMKSQDPVRSLKPFQELENREAPSSTWLYDSKRATSTTMPSSRSARTALTKAGAEKGTIAVGNDVGPSSSMWCSESFGTMIQDCFATAPSQQPEAIQDAPKTPTPQSRNREPPTDAPAYF